MKFIKIAIILLPILLSAQPTLPGFFNEDGSVHAIPDPAQAPSPWGGEVINITDYNVDLADNDFDDTPAINEAFGDAGVGDVVYFPNGVYNLNSASSTSSTAHIDLQAQEHILGESREGAIFVSNFSPEFNAANSTIVIKATDIAGSLMKNFTITSSYSGSYSTNPNVNNTDKSAPAYGIYIDDSGDSPSFKVTIDSVKIEKVWRMMIRVANSYDIVIKNSIFQNATDVGGGGAGYGISIQGDGHGKNNYGKLNDSRYNYVENCQFIGPYLRHGVIIQYYSHNNWIKNNYFYKTVLDAIDLHGEDEYLNDIDSNVAEDVTTGGGVVLGNTGVEHDASGYGNYIHHNILKNNREGVKIYLGSPDTRIENNTISGTTLAGAIGIKILNGPRTKILNNSIVDNSASGFMGILLDYDYGTLGNYFGAPDSVIISGNTIGGNENGMVLNRATNVMLGNNTIENNSTNQYIDASVTFIDYTEIISSNIPDEFLITAPYPNPFNPSVTIEYALPYNAKVKLRLYDLQGRYIKDLVSAFQEQGQYSVQFKPTNLSSGIYFIHYVFDDKQRFVQKINYLK